MHMDTIEKSHQAVYTTELKAVFNINERNTATTEKGLPLTNDTENHKEVADIIKGRISGSSNKLKDVMNVINTHYNVTRFTKDQCRSDDYIVFEEKSEKVVENAYSNEMYCLKQGYGYSQYGIKRLAEGSDIEAADMFKLATRLGNADSAFMLSELYRNGRGVKLNSSKAETFLQLAKERGCKLIDAKEDILPKENDGIWQTDKAGEYRDGFNIVMRNRRFSDCDLPLKKVVKNDKKNIKEEIVKDRCTFYRDSASSLESENTSKVGITKGANENVTIDCSMEKIIKVEEESDVDQKNKCNSNASILIGSEEAVRCSKKGFGYYEIGQNLWANGYHIEAFIMFKLAAKYGCAEAAFKLSECYLKGIGVEKSEVKSEKFLQQGCMLDANKKEILPENGV